MALDATLVSTHHGDGTPLRKSDKMDGVALQLARRRKETRFPELSGSHGRARLVVIVGEVGGRWSRETQAFLQSLAHCKAQGAPRILRASAEVAWYRSGAVCWRVRRPISLLERRGNPGAAGQLPSVQV